MHNSSSFSKAPPFFSLSLAWHKLPSPQASFQQTRWTSAKENMLLLLLLLKGYVAAFKGARPGAAVTPTHRGHMHVQHWPGPWVQGLDWICLVCLHEGLIPKNSSGGLLHVEWAAHIYSFYPGWLSFSHWWLAAVQIGHVLLSICGIWEYVRELIRLVTKAPKSDSLISSAPGCHFGFLLLSRTLRLTPQSDKECYASLCTFWVKLNPEAAGEGETMKWLPQEAEFWEPNGKPGMILQGTGNSPCTGFYWSE